MADKLKLLHVRWRNRLIASARLRAFSSWVLPVRWLARHYARRVFDLTAGFVYSQTAQALVESGLLSRLLAGPLSLAEASTTAALPLRATETLLKAAASVDLVERVGDHFVAGRLGVALAVTPGLAEMICHHRLLYADLADPLAMLRAGQGRLAGLWRYGDNADRETVAHYSALMAATLPMIAEQVIDAYPFARHARLLDIGGGRGRFLQAVAGVAADIEFALLDRPAVIDQARIELAASRLTVDFHPGSFDDDLPRGYDLITLVRVLHDHDDDVVQQLLARVHAALPGGGRVLIIEPLADTAHARPMGHAYFGLYLASMASGRPRTANEYRTMLAGAGFKKMWRARTAIPLIAGLIVGQK